MSACELAVRPRPPPRGGGRAHRRCAAPARPDRVATPASSDRRGRQRLDAQPAHSRAGQRPRPCRGVASRRSSGERSSSAAREACAGSRTGLEALRDAEPIGHRVRALRRRRAVSAPPPRPASAVRERQPAERSRTVAARTSGSASIFSRAASGARRGVESRNAAGASVALPPAAPPARSRWPLRRGSPAADVAATGAMSGISDGRSRRPSARTATRTVCASPLVQAGADDREVARRRRAAILGLQHGEPTSGLRGGARAAGARRTIAKKNRKNAETRKVMRSRDLPRFAPVLRSHPQVPRRRRVLEHLCVEIQRVRDRDVGDRRRRRR